MKFLTPKAFTRARLITTALLGIFTTLVFTAVPAQSKQPRVEVCHNGFVISVAGPALAAHLDHGDGLAFGGECLIPAPE